MRHAATHPAPRRLHRAGADAVGSPSRHRNLACVGSPRVVGAANAPPISRAAV